MAVWREAGFVLFDLGSRADGMLDELFAESRSFFALPQEEKGQCADPEVVYFGYQQRREFDKELFQVRPLHCASRE
jgi:isopenicillin N synthase-like dioxygenase